MSRTVAVLCLLVGCLIAGRGLAQDEFHDHMEVWSTELDGGQLAVEYDFAGKRPPLFFSGFCDPLEGCLYSTINPAVLTPLLEEDVPGDGLYPLRDGTSVSIEIIALSAGLSMFVNGEEIEEGESAGLGSAPFHTHPSYQLLAPEGEVSEYELTFKLRAASGYGESDMHTITFTNEQPILATATPSPLIRPTPTATPIATGCAGDCNGDGTVSTDELVTAVMIVLGEWPLSRCAVLDRNGGPGVTVDELMMAVEAALGPCAPVTLARIQSTIFTPSCATPFCHSAAFPSNGLSLAAGESYAQTVNVLPTNNAARVNGLLRVAPGNPDNSFLYVKLLNPPFIYGARMPSGGSSLPAEQIELVRKWIAQGALR